MHKAFFLGALLVTFVTAASAQHDPVPRSFAGWEKPAPTPGGQGSRAIPEPRQHRQNPTVGKALRKVGGFLKANYAATQAQQGGYQASLLTNAGAQVWSATQARRAGVSGKSIGLNLLVQRFVVVVGHKAYKEGSPGLATLTNISMAGVASFAAVRNAGVADRHRTAPKKWAIVSIGGASFTAP